MFKVNFVELTKEVAQGKEYKLEMAIRDAMCEAAGMDLPLTVTFDRARNASNIVMKTLRGLDYLNKPVSFTQDFLIGFFEEFITSFRESFNAKVNR